MIIAKLRWAALWRKWCGSHQPGPRPVHHPVDTFMMEPHLQGMAKALDQIPADLLRTPALSEKL